MKVDTNFVDNPITLLRVTANKDEFFDPFFNMENPIHFATFVKGAMFAISPYFTMSSFLNSVTSS